MKQLEWKNTQVEFATAITHDMLGAKFEIANIEFILANAYG